MHATSPYVLQLSWVSGATVLAVRVEVADGDHRVVQPGNMAGLTARSSRAHLFVAPPSR
jgi:hypothetical protein